MSRERLDKRVLPRGVAAALVLIALGFAALWLQHHGVFEARALRDGLRTDRFHLRHVDFTGLDALEATALWQAAGVAPGTPLLDVDPEAVCRELSGVARVARVRAARVPPDRLVVAVAERVPVALELSSGLGLDAEGARFPLEPAERERLPQLSGETRRGLVVLAAARAERVNLATVHAPPGEPVRVRALGQATELVIGRDPAASLADWRKLADSGLVEHVLAAEVDLRWRGNPVLRGVRNSTGGETGGQDGKTR